MNYETAAFLAQHLKPEQLFANAAAFITAVLNGDFNPDTLSFDAQASVTPVAATAPQVEAPTSQAQPENVQYTEIRKLGTYPVVSDADMTPADEGKTKVEKGFEDTTDNGINDSPIEKSARAAAMKFFNGDVEEVERFMKWFHENQQYYVDGSHQQGYSKDGFRDVFVEKGEAVMGERNGGAKDVKINFDKPEQATRGTYVTSDGVRVNADVYDTCANPQLSMAEPEKSTPTPAPVTEEKTEACVDPNSVPVGEWKTGVLPSKEGVVIDNVSYKEVRVIYAPEGMTEEEALAKLREWAEVNDPKGLRGGYLLFTDSVCDGVAHPDRIQCVSFSAGSDGQVTMKDEVFNGNPGQKVGPSRGDTDYDRMSRRTQEKVLAN